MKVIKGHTLQFILVLLCALSLAACGGGHKDLQTKVNKILARPGTKIEELPEIEPFIPHKYSKNDNRSPFKPESKVSSVENSLTPDVSRPKEELEQFALDSLTMVGTLGRGKNIWALIAAPNGGVYRVRVGNFMGKNYGRVKKITKESMEIIETVPDGQGGWVHRTSVLDLKAKD